MTEERLQEHGYPRPHPERSGRAVVHNIPEKNNVDRKSLQSTYKPSSVWGWILLDQTHTKKCSSTNLFSFQAFAKVCCRCGAEYKITANGNCVRKEECNHHWGRLRRHKGLLFCLITCTLFSFLHAVKGKMLGFECSCPFWMELVRASVRL